LAELTDRNELIEAIKKALAKADADGLVMCAIHLSNALDSLGNSDHHKPKERK